MSPQHNEICVKPDCANACLTLQTVVTVIMSSGEEDMLVFFVFCFVIAVVFFPESVASMKETVSSFVSEDLNYH